MRLLPTRELRTLRAADPVGYREMFSNFIPLDARPAKSIQTGSLK